MFVAISTLQVPEEAAKELEERFLNRSRKVDGYEGFIRLRLLRRRGSHTQYAFVTEWASQAAFQAYMKSHDYGDAHAKVPPEFDAVIENLGLAVYDAVVDSARGE
ncbi:MAG TPA: antibiotic biosynthesis monooxygenase [Candidatus Thermoplasmatota archaeon]|nr:antibiotic biosynthesis monooxygenase [Candidatus Thermoplasmatota archaeon]